MAKKVFSLLTGTKITVENLGIFGINFKAKIENTEALDIKASFREEKANVQNFKVIQQFKKVYFFLLTFTRYLT